MAEEVLVHFTSPIKGVDGELYVAQACGGQKDDGLWEGWVQFTSESTGKAYRSGRETTQPNRQDVLYWAEGLSEVYLEGALARALVAPKT